MIYTFHQAPSHHACKHTCVHPSLHPFHSFIHPCLHPSILHAQVPRKPCRVAPYWLIKQQIEQSWGEASIFVPIHPPHHAYMHTYIFHSSIQCLNIPAYIHIPAHMQACIHAYMDTGIHAYMHTWIQAYMHTCIQAYIHTYMHAYRQL